MRNTPLQLDEQFFVIHPDLAALKKEINAKKKLLADLNIRQKRLKREMEEAQYEFEQRIAVLQNWQRLGALKKKNSDRHSPISGES